MTPDTRIRQILRRYILSTLKRGPRIFADDRRELIDAGLLEEFEIPVVGSDKVYRGRRLTDAGVEVIREKQNDER